MNEEEIQCPHCGYVADIEDNVCPQCGKSIAVYEDVIF